MTDELTREEKLEDCLQRACVLALTTSDALVALIEAVWPDNDPEHPRIPVLTEILERSRAERAKLMARIEDLAAEDREAL